MADRANFARAAGFYLADRMSHAIDRDFLCLRGDVRTGGSGGGDGFDLLLTRIAQAEIGEPQRQSDLAQERAQFPDFRIRSLLERNLYQGSVGGLLAVQ